MPTVSLDGEEHEVDASAIHYGEDEAPEGFVSASNHQAAIQSRVERAKRDTRKALANDGDFLRDAYSQHAGVELREDGRPKGAPTDEDLQGLRKQAAKAETLEEEMQGLRDQVKGARIDRLAASIQTGLDDVKPGLRQAATAQIASKFDFDESEGAWVHADESKRYTVDDGESRLTTPSDLIGSLGDDWLKDQSAQSSGMQGGASNGSVTREEFEDKMARSDQLSDDEFDRLMKAHDEGLVTD